MYAVIKTGGKQYKVSDGELFSVETLPGQEGETVELTEVLMVVDGETVKIGAPFIEGAVVKAEITGHGRGPKVRIVKYRRRKHYRKQMGHRQNFTELKVTAIQAG